MKKTILTFSVAGMMALAGCGNDNNNGRQQGEQGGQDGSNLGAQIDRMGRPGITTALIGTFDADTDSQGQLKDRFNSVSNGGDEFVEEIANNLAIYDALAGECGDNALTATGEGADTYNEFAGVLANDMLLINSEHGRCNTYLAVELGESGDCGGRTPTMDVIDTTYSVVAAGAPSGVSDGISSDDRRHSTRNFPFLARPRSGGSSGGMN